MNLPALWDLVVELSPRSSSMIHGLGHWRQVEKNGLRIAEESGADPLVVSLFALFHDSCRENEGRDPEHGPRGAELALSLRDSLPPLTDEQLDLLVCACTHHTHEDRHDDPTIGTCWDADRLDLPRVGIRVAQRFLSTEAARALLR